MENFVLEKIPKLFLCLWPVLMKFSQVPGHQDKSRHTP